MADKINTPTEAALSAEVSGNKTRRIETRNAVTGQIEDGTNPEGAFLLARFREQLAPPRDTSGNINLHLSSDPTVTELRSSVQEMYQQTAFLDSESPGSENKLMIALKAINKQIGREEYKVRIPEDTPPENSREAIRNQMRQDADVAFREATLYLMDDYIDTLVDMQIQREDLVREINKPDASDVSITNATANVLSLWVLEEKARLIALRDAQRTEQLLVGLPTRTTDRPTFQGEAFTPLEDISPSEKDLIIDQGIVAYTDNVNAKYGENGVKSFNAIDEQTKKLMITRMLEAERRIAHHRELLTKAVAAEDPNNVYGQVIDLRQAEEDRLVASSQIEVLLAGNRRRESFSKVRESWGSLQDAILDNITTSGGAEVKQVAENVARSMREVVRSHVHSAKAVIDQAITPSIQKIETEGDITRASLARVIDQVDQVVADLVGNEVAVTGVGLDQVLENFRVTTARNRALAEKEGLQAEIDRRNKLHSAKIGFYKALPVGKANIAAAFKHSVASLIGDTSENEATRQKARAAHEATEKKLTDDIREIDQKLRRQLGDNPDFTYLLEFVEGEVILVSVSGEEKELRKKTATAEDYGGPGHKWKAVQMIGETEEEKKEREAGTQPVETTGEEELPTAVDRTVSIREPEEAAALPTDEITSPDEDAPENTPQARLNRALLINSTMGSTASSRSPKLGYDQKDFNEFNNLGSDFDALVEAYNKEADLKEKARLLAVIERRVNKRKGLFDNLFPET